MTTRWVRICAAMVVLLLTAACLNEAPPLMRDGADLYPAEAEAAAESRLQALARQTGLWVFVVTAAEPDPPRMLDEPMAIADARGARAIALMFGPDGPVSYGTSGAFVGSLGRLAALDFTPMQGRNTAAALDELLTEVEAWATGGHTPEPVAPGAGEEVGPSGAP